MIHFPSTAAHGRECISIGWCVSTQEAMSDAQSESNWWLADIVALNCEDCVDTGNNTKRLASSVLTRNP